MWTVGSRASVGCAQEERNAGSPAASTLSTSSLDPPLRAAKDGCTHLHRNVVVDEEREGLGTNVAGTEVHDDLGVVGGETTGDWDGVSVRSMSMVFLGKRLACAVGPTRAGAKCTRRRRVAAGRVLVSLILGSTVQQLSFWLQREGESGDSFTHSASRRARRRGW